MVDDDYTMDEEFKRAQEMALAVAALGSSNKKPSSAEAIRQAVADAMCGEKPNDHHKKRKRRKRKQKDSAQYSTTTMTTTTMTTTVSQTSTDTSRTQTTNTTATTDGNSQTKKKELDDEDAGGSLSHFMWFMITSVIKDQLGVEIPSIPISKLSLQGQDLLVVVAVAHGCLLSLTLLPSSIMYLCTAIVVLNTTIFYRVTSATTTTTADESDQEEENVSSSNYEEERMVQQILMAPLNRRSVSDNSFSSSSSKRQRRFEWLEDVHFPQSDLSSLQALQPESTLAERRRFLKARKGSVEAASAQLGSYLEWRLENRVNEFFPAGNFTTDADDWKRAARGALELSATKYVPLPRLVSVLSSEDEHGSEDLCYCCKNGARLIHVLPCQLDASLASLNTYALAVAMYLDAKLDRSYTEKVTVVIDIRFGEGWKNPSSVSIVPFIKLVVGLLNSYFPERLSKCILFPLPRTATMLFNTAKSYLDPDTASKIQVCSGAGSIKSPVPTQVYEFLDVEAVEGMEERRLSFFR